MQRLTLIVRIAIEIPDAVIATRLLETKSGRLIEGVWDTDLVFRYLNARILADPTSRHDVLGKINSVVNGLMPRHSGDGRKKDADLMRAFRRGLCRLVATQFKSLRSQILSDESCEQKSACSTNEVEDVVNNLLAAEAYFGLGSWAMCCSYAESVVSTIFGTPIECAALGGRCDITGFYLDLALNAQNGPAADLQNPLCAAARAGHYDIVCLFTETKYRCLLSQVRINKVINAAIQGNHPKIISLLLDSVDLGSAVSLSNNMLLEAAFYGQIDMVRLALDTGAGGDSHEQKAYYNLALQRAASQGHVHVVELLLTRGAEYLMSLNKYHAMVRATRLGFQRVVQMLLDHGANVNELAADGLSPLEAAAAHGQAGMVEFLIDKVDLNKYPDIGISAVTYAASYKSASTIRVLARHGIYVDDIETQTKIMNAAHYSGGKEVIQALLDSGIKGLGPASEANGSRNRF